MAFRLVGFPIGDLSLKINLRNFITFITRHVVFKNRYIDFGGKEIAKTALKIKIRNKIRKELTDKWISYRARNLKEDFESKYLIENILGQIENDNLTFNI